MVLRAGIILPFQFGDVKKLLMVGSPEEDRDLKLFDFTNVVRAAFNIYNFEFRNKKIDFLIPEELLIHYLEQCRDLTNFVIQVDQAGITTTNNTTTITNATATTVTINGAGNPTVLSEICSQHKPDIHKPKQVGTESSLTSMGSAFGVEVGSTATPRNDSVDLSSPLDVTSHSDRSTSNNTDQPMNKIRRSEFYVDRTPESLTQSIDPNDIMPKSEQEDTEMHANKIRQQTSQLSSTHNLLQTQSSQQQQQQIQLAHQTSHFLPNYSHTLLSVPSTAGHLQMQNSMQLQTQTHNSHHLQHATNRFRRRGERMSKDQKELYVRFFEENPCMLQQRRNDAALAPLWNKLANMLNHVQQGAVKNVEEWKQTFDAWRYRVFMYSRYNSKLSGDAAQNPKNYKPLTHTDQRAYSMWTSHRNCTNSEYDKMDMFAGLDETHTDDYDY